MDLICIKDEKQLALLNESGYINDRKSFILPLMPKAALGLFDLGMSNIQLPIDFLSKEERESIYEQAIDFSMSWNKHLKLKVEYNGIDLINCCRLQMLGFFQDVLAAELIAPRLIEEFKPKRALFLKRPSVPSCGHSMHDGTADVFEAVLQWRFYQAGINVVVPPENILNLIKKQIKNITPIFYTKIAPILYTKYVQEFNFYKHKFISGKTDSNNSRRIKLSNLPDDKPVLVGFGSGYDLLIIWPYLKAIAQEIDGVPVVINGNAVFDPSTLRSGLNIDKDLRYIFIGDIPPSYDKSPNLREHRENCLTALKNGDLLPQRLQNPLLDFQFILFWDLLVPMALRAARQATSFFAKYNTSLYLDDNCAGVANRAWTEAGNLAGVTTISVPHGAIGLLEFHDFNSKWAFAWGELGRRNWALACPKKQSHVIVSGDPSMEDVRAKFVDAKEDNRNAVLFLTGGFPHQAWTNMYFQGFISTWEEIARITKQMPQIEFIVKTHPSVRDLGDWYKSFIKKKALPNIKVIDNQKLEAILPSAFLAVLVGQPGTAGLVSALAGVPFIYLDTMHCRDVIGFRIWRDENGVPRLTNTKQLAEIVDKMYSSNEERKKLLEQNHRFLSLYLTPFQPQEVCKQIGLKIINKGLRIHT